MRGFIVDLFQCQRLGLGKMRHLYALLMPHSRAPDSDNELDFWPDTVLSYRRVYYLIITPPNSRLSLQQAIATSGIEHAEKLSLHQDRFLFRSFRRAAPLAQDKPKDVTGVAVGSRTVTPALFVLGYCAARKTIIDSSSGDIGYRPHSSALRGQCFYRYRSHCSRGH